MASAAPSDNRSLVCVGPVKPQRGRPSTYTPEIAREICERIAAGETLTGICLDEDMPAVRTITNWLMRHEDFFADLQRAKEMRAHIEAERISEIADNAYEDYYIDYDKDGKPFVVVNGESVRRAQLRIEARKWRASVDNRKAYGNSVKHEIGPVHPAHAADSLPPGLEWLAGRLSAPKDGPEPDPGAMGEG